MYGLTTQRELIGNSGRIPSGFFGIVHDSDEEGNNDFPSGTKTTWKLKRKAEAIYEVLGSMDMINWTPITGYTLNETDNTIIFNTAPANGSSLLITYKGYSSMGEEYVSGSELRVANVDSSGWFGNANWRGHGAVLIQSCIGKIPTGFIPTSTNLSYRFVLDGYSLNWYGNGKIGKDAWTKKPSHAPLPRIGDDVALKVMSVLFVDEPSNKFYLGLVYNEDVSTSELTINRESSVPSSKKMEGIRIIELPYHVPKLNKIFGLDYPPKNC